MIGEYFVMSYVNEPKKFSSDMFKFTILQYSSNINDHPDAICDMADYPTL